MPIKKELVGYDVAIFCSGSSPECSPLSCNGLADEIAVNSDCLLSSFADVFQTLDSGKFDNSERGHFVFSLCMQYDL